jgi:hypothetical protein
MTTTSRAKVIQIAQFRMPPTVFQVSLTLGLLDHDYRDDKEGSD